jgi:DNA-binding XRE family transcriptional regulator
MKSDKWYEKVSRSAAGREALVKYMSPRERLAYYVNDHRKLFKQSQAVLAAKAGTTQRVISLIEAECYNPSLELLERLAGAMGMRLDVAMRPKERD